MDPLPVIIPPPLLRLPVELHREIISNLELQDHALLSCTSRYFAWLIKPPTFDEFLAAETKPWAISKNLYACKGCKRFQHLLQFADDMRKAKRGRHGLDAHTRFCVKCGVDQHWYPAGTEFTIMGEPYVVCMLCEVVTDRVSARGACLPTLQAVRKKRVDLTSAGRHYESEDDWGHALKSFAGGKHSEEMYGIWPDV